ncbi:MAG: geranylgeranyl reductase family protein [Anaerolineae bacterium]|nr:geranylgeranyl reductase family protein [Anaerolineae bacterium]
MRRPDFDAIVAGAGAGGAAAAYYLTRAGLKTLVVDKAQLPRYKACGGAIPQTALDRFPFAMDSVIQAKPEEVRLTFPGRRPVDVSLPGRPVAMVMRQEFDALLLAQSGAEVLDGTAVTGVVEDGAEVRVETGRRALTARYLVGADGAASTVARRLGLRSQRRLGGTLEAEVPLGDPGLRADYGTRAIFCFGAVPWGYAWVFPKRDHLSVGIGRFRPGKVDLRSALVVEMERLGIRLDGIPLRGHPLPCYQAPLWPFWFNSPQEQLSTRRCLLVGDAAGLVDPLIGEGIRYAMTSARLAVEAIARDDLSGYEQAIWQEIGHDLATSGLLAELYYRLPGFCFEVGLRNPEIVQQFVGVLTERFRHQGIGRRILAASARWALQGKPSQPKHVG